MKIDIKHSTHTTGLIFKKTFHKIDLLVELTDEEKAIIKERKLEKHVIMELPDPASFESKNNDWGFDLTFGSLLSGKFWYDVNTPAEAKAYQEKLIEKLKVAKDYLQNNATTAEDTSIEL